MYRQITLTLMILMLITSCGTKKQISKSISENNITTQIDDSTQIKTSSKTTTETNDTTNITIQEEITETITDSLNRQTTQRTINRTTTVNKAGNTVIKQTEEADTTHTTKTQIQEQKKEDNQITTTINKTNPIRKYISVIFFIIVAVFIYHSINKK